MADLSKNPSHAHSFQEDCPPNDGLVPQDASGEATIVASQNNQILAKSWNYTLSEYTATEVEALKNLSCSLHVLGYEVGEQASVPHVQGFITFKKTMSRVAVLKLFPSRTFVQKTRNRDAMEAYCKKAGEFDMIDNRVRSKAGAKARAVFAIIKEDGGSLARVERDHPGFFIRHMAMLERYAVRHVPTARPTPVVEWCFGPTGTGKSLYALQSGGEDAYWHSGVYRWWPMYRGQHVVILDDIRADFAPLHTLLRLFDGYPLVVEIKGGHRVVQATRFIVTTSAPPALFYSSKSGSDEDVRQLLRRISCVLSFGRSANCVTGMTEYSQTDCTKDMECGSFFV